MKVLIYTDGAHSSGSLVGGIGALFLVDNKHNKSWNISDQYTSKPTNQRCELEAIRRGLEFIIPKISDKDSVEVHTDSTYSIGCLNVWYKNWQNNGWVNSKKAPVENQDIIKPTLELLDKFPSRPFFKHVKGHADNEWNNEADKLAVAGKTMKDKLVIDSDEDLDQDSHQDSDEDSVQGLIKDSNRELIIKKMKELEGLVQDKMKEILELV